MIRRIFAVLFLSFIIISCRGTKNITSSEIDKSLSAKSIIEEHLKTEPKFKTLASRVQVEYKDDKSSQSMTVSLRMEKDKTIWISASILGFTMAKLMITPDRVSYYESIDNTFFDGDYSLLSHWLGIDVDFEMAQNILLGNTIFPLEAKNYAFSVSDNHYIFTPKRQQPAFEHSFLLNTLFRAALQKLIQPKEQRVLQINYRNYQVINHQVFPKNIQIIAQEGDSQTSISLDYRNIDVNAGVSFPFKIPNGYKELTFD